MNELLSAAKALADESRIRVLYMLEAGPLCVCEVQAVLKLSQSSVSRHLQLLEEAGLIVSERHGSWKYVGLPGAPSPLVQGLLSQVRSHAVADPEAARVRAAVARNARLGRCASGPASGRVA